MWQPCGLFGQKELGGSLRIGGDQCLNCERIMPSHFRLISVNKELFGVNVACLKLGIVERSLPSYSLLNLEEKLNDTLLKNFGLHQELK